jgi:transcriptional regulator with XRE-family HTH domain
MKLIARDSLIYRMETKGFSRSSLAAYAQVSLGTIDNLIVGRTRSVNRDETAKLICRALDVPVDVYFESENSNQIRCCDKSCKTA